eukprot:3380557-Pyramimonas_sp.AAC.1
MPETSTAPYTFETFDLHPPSVHAALAPHPRVMSSHPLSTGQPRKLIRENKPARTTEYGLPTPGP